MIDLLSNLMLMASGALWAGIILNICKGENS